MRRIRHWSPAGGPASRSDISETSVAPLADGLNPLSGAPGDAAREESGARFARTLHETDLFDAIDRLGYRESPAMRFAAVARLRDLAFHAGERGELPLFARTSHHLSAALRFDESAEMRRRIGVALGEIADGATGGYAGVLLRDVADANRSALAAFLEALGQFLARHSRGDESGDADLMRYVAELAEFAPDQSGVHCLLDMADDPACARAVRLSGLTSGGGGPRRVQATTRSDEGVDVLWEEAERLRDCVAPLVAALRAASGGAGSPSAPLSAPGTFLASADLAGRDLRGADLSGAYLHGATLAKARLANADLSGACLAGAYLAGVSAAERDAPESLADFTDADWWNAAPDSWFGEAGSLLRQVLLRRFPPPASLRGGASGVAAPARGEERAAGKSPARGGAPRRTARTLFESGPAGETPGLLRDSTGR